MGKTLTVNTGYTNVWLGQGSYNGGDEVVVSDAEFDILVENFGSEEALETVVTIGADDTDPVYPEPQSFTVQTLVSDVNTLQGDVDDLETADTAIGGRLDALEANDVIQDAAIADHEDRITVLEP